MAIVGVAGYERVLPYFEVDSAAAVAIDEKIAAVASVWGSCG